MLSPNMPSLMQRYCATTAVVLLGLLLVQQVAAQSTTETAPRPRLPASPSQLNQQTLGLEVSLWNRGMSDTGTVNGLALSLRRVRTQTVNGIAAGLVGVDVERSVRGIAVGGLGVGTEHDLWGVALSGFGIGTDHNITGVAIALFGIGSANMTGFMSAGFGIGVDDRLRGIQLAGVGIGGRTLEGIMLAGLGIGATDARGFFSAPYVHVEDDGHLAGLSIAGFNHVEGQQIGVTIGIVNYAAHLRGIQLGLLNYAGNKARPFRLLPLVNASF